MVTVLQVTSQQIVIGRASDADLQLDDDLISRRHLRVWLGPHGLCVEDLDSRNGTYLNGCAISSQVLQETDELRIGDTTMKFSYNEPSREMWQILEASRPNHHLGWVRLSAHEEETRPDSDVFADDSDSKKEEMQASPFKRVANLHY